MYFLNHLGKVTTINFDSKYFEKNSANRRSLLFNRTRFRGADISMKKSKGSTCI